MKITLMTGMGKNKRTRFRRENHGGLWRSVAFTRPIRDNRSENRSR